MAHEATGKVACRVEGGVALVELNRPDALNALDPEMNVRLAGLWAELRETDAVRVVVVTGRGRAFCAGADLRRLIPLLGGARAAEDDWDEAVLADPQLVYRAVLRDFDVGKPVIAAINGDAISGGMEMVQGTDLRIAARSARFGLQEVRWGIAPGGGSTVRLPAQIPLVHAMELLLTGDLIDAQAAHGFGFLNRVVDDGEAVSAAMALAARIADNAPLAVRAIRASVRACRNLPEAEAMLVEHGFIEPLLSTEDAREGMRAFAERRKAVFTGR